MRLLPLLARAAATATLLLSLAQAQPALAPAALRFDSSADFKALPANWQPAGGLAGDPRRDKTLTPAPGNGVLVCVPTKAAHGHLFTAWEHADIELDLEFMMAPGANSGVYLQGRYEVQLFDSWGVAKPTPADCGGIYQRWDDKRGKGNEGYEGIAPRANACRAPGLWQKLHIEFEAPRFDAAGKKTRAARFRKVVLNDFVIHEDVEVNGPTRSSAFDDEKPFGPLMIQGDHGSVALRNLRVKRFDPSATVTVEGVTYQLYTGDLKRVGDYGRDKLKSEGTPSRFAHSAVEKTGKFALVFNGTLRAPRDGDYLFAAETNATAALSIDGQPVLLPQEKGGGSAIVRLTAGTHNFRLDHFHNIGGRPSLDITVEGPQVAPQPFTAAPDRRTNNRRDRAILLEPADGRVLLQRGFVPYEPKKRLYAISVGTPGGAHFAYDFETNALLRVWRGGWLDAQEMWEGRGEHQLARPTGPALTLNAKPTVALLEFPRTAAWPTQEEALFTSQGYTLEANGQPVFRSKLGDVKITDRIASIEGGRGVERTLTFNGKLISWDTCVLLAESERITEQPAGGWVIGDREYYVDYPANAAHRPQIQTRGGRQQLVVRLTNATLNEPLSYRLLW